MEGQLFEPSRYEAAALLMADDDDAAEALDLELYGRDDPYRYAPLGSPYSDD
jgi:hypothetical protein